MSGDNSVVPPPVLWAQRPTSIFLTVCVEDCKDPIINIDMDKIYFKAVGGAEKKNYELTIPLFKEILPHACVKSVKDRNIELLLRKKVDSNWPSLTNDKMKHHWLKVDFARWRDEDDSDNDMPMGVGEGGGEDLEAMMRQMGGLGGEGMEKPNFDELDATTDSDDDELPDLV